jgi:hypothetical protein
MIINVYQTAQRYSASVLHAELVAVVETDTYPDDPQVFADLYDGDFIEIVEES